MPVYKILEEMPHDELQGWMSFFEKNPVGWREDFRAAQMIRGFGTDIKGEQIFSSLAAIKKQVDEQADKKEEGFVDAQTLKGSSFFNKILSAQGGENILELANDAN